MEFKKVKIFVFGGSHYNTLGLIKSLGKEGYPIYVFLEHCNWESCDLRLSKYIKKLYHLNSLEDSLSILKAEYWNEKERPIVLCASDASICFLDKHYNILKDKFCIFNSKEQQGEINRLMEKINTFPIAERSGFSVIKTWRVNSKSQLPDNITFPCLIKGNSSVTSLKTDMAKCENWEDLNENFHEGIDYLVQEYIEKDFEIDVVGFAYNHGKNCIVKGAVRKIRDDLQRQSVYIRLDNLEEYSSKISVFISKYIAEIGYDGIFSIELLAKDDKFYFLENNLRNDGNGYLYTAAGINYPLCWVKYCTGTLNQDYVNKLNLKTPFYLMQMYDIYNMFEGKVSLFKWIKQAITADAYYVLDIHDIKPFIHSFFICSRQFLKKLFRKIIRS